MKKLILIFVLFPMLIFGQGREHFQKQSFRSGGMGMYSGPSTMPNSRQSFESQQKQTYRNEARQGNAYIIPSYPYYNDYLWYRQWPYYYGYNYYMPYYWYDNWGYRNPGRIYVYDNGKQDTVKIKAIPTYIGASYNTMPEIGMWLMAGRSVFFIFDYTNSIQIDASTYYSNISINDATGWNDKQLKTQQNSNLFAAGFGTHITKSFSAYAQYGVGRIQKKYKFYDEMHILSNNGQYSFPQSKETIFNLKVGALYFLPKNIVARIDYDIQRKAFLFGAGIKI